MKGKLSIGILIVSVFFLGACALKEPSLIIESTKESESRQSSKKALEEDSKGEKENPEKEREENSGEDLQKEKKEPKEKAICVYVCGEVHNPGVYELKEGDRIFHLIEAAGGLKEEADEKMLNQAKPLKDGEQITVYSRQETAANETLTGKEGSSFSSGEGKKIDINTADEETLMQISGVGSQRAKAIIKYRQDNGGFSSIEDIMQVEGIKKGMFEKIKEQISAGG